MGVKYAKQTGFVGRVRIKKGDAWDSESDVVKAMPGLFDDEPTQVKGQPAKAATRPAKRTAKAAEKPELDESEEDEGEEEPRQRIERATRAPGEKRGPRGPRRSE